MTDLSKTIAPKSDQMNADDLIGGPVDILITAVKGGDDIQPINIFYQGDNGKPYKPCKSMRRILVSAWGSNGHEYVGRTLRLFCDPQVKFGGIAVGGIRVSHMSHIEKDLTVALTASKAVRKPYTVKRLDVSPPPPSLTKEDAIQMGKSAASCGTDTFKAWWNSKDGKPARELFKDDKAVMDDLLADCQAEDGRHEGDK